MHLKALCKPLHLPNAKRGILTKTLLIMKFTAILVLVACLQSQGKGFAQAITLTLKNTPLEKVFKEVKKQTGYTFIYTREQLERTVSVSLDVKSASLQQVLDECFRTQPITYTVEGRFVVIKPRPLPAMPWRPIQVHHMRKAE